MNAEPHKIAPHGGVHHHLQVLAQAQGVQPWKDLKDFTDPDLQTVWPDEENLDDFLSWLYASRRGETSI